MKYVILLCFLPSLLSSQDHLRTMIEWETEMTQDYIDFVAVEPCDKAFLQGRLSAFMQVTNFLDNPEHIKYYSN